MRSHSLFLSVSQIKQLDSQSAQSIDSVKTLYVMKSRPLQDQLVDSIYKSKDTTGAVAAQRREDVFTDVSETICWFVRSLLT